MAEVTITTDWDVEMEHGGPKTIYDREHSENRGYDIPRWFHRQRCEETSISPDWVLARRRT